MFDFYKNFIGLETKYFLADGTRSKRIHLDGAASPLVMKTAIEARDRLLPHYSNSHSFAHTSAHICGQAHSWAYDTILSVCGATLNEKKRQNKHKKQTTENHIERNATNYSLVSLGNGSTGVINNIARRLKSRSTEKPIILVSAMEHHANDLPHREQTMHESKAIHYIPLVGDSSEQGMLDLVALEELLKLNAGKVNYVTFSGVSNVTGIVNPISEIVALAHKYDALAVLDAAQTAPHMALNIAAHDIDFIAFSGHKIYCAGSPGILIAKSKLLKKYPSDEVGGGVIDYVSYHEVDYLDTYPQREQAGTKNVLGLYSLAKVMQAMHDFGFDHIRQHGNDLWQYAANKLSTITGLIIYGKSQEPRLGALSFNIENLDHGFVAAVLNDYFGIAVRNECFCAHPYVSSLIKEQLWAIDLEQFPDAEHDAVINRKRGMVRASFSLYNTHEDVDKLVNALTLIINNQAQYIDNYNISEDGDYIHKNHHDFSVSLDELS